MYKNKILILFIIFITIVSCKKNVFTPLNIPPKTEFEDDPIANLSIPSKDAAVKVTPYQLKNYSNRVYGHVNTFFTFNGRYFITFLRRYEYRNEGNNIKVSEIAPAGKNHLVELNKTTKQLEEIAVNLDDAQNSQYAGLNARYNEIAKGNAYEGNNNIYVPIDINDLNKGYYQSSDLVKWETNNNILDISSLKKKEASDTARIKVGKYTYVYTGGGLKFSIDRLNDRMKQLSQRLETKFTFKEEDFNNMHMFDIGLNSKNTTSADFRINPTNFFNNDINYSWIGMLSPHQIWLMPFKDNTGKEYLIRFVEYCTGLYSYQNIIKEMNEYRKKSETSLSKALAAVASSKPKDEIEKACFDSIKNDAEYKVRKYFLDEAVKSKLDTNNNSFAYKVTPNKPITHYVIEFINIQ